MENKLTNDEIDLIMRYIPCVTEMGVNTELWNKLKRMKTETDNGICNLDKIKLAQLQADYCVLNSSLEAGVHFGDGYKAALK